ncbi:MAG: metallophosphatase family protein [Actinomycetota bacterium]|nr:metallophosphatase family protein [Actinomycetota bacterium]
MRIAVISDIHANLPALEAVMAEIDKDAPDEIWCLGDVVGYGAQPNECSRIAAERSDLCLAGNHDLAALDALDISSFSPAAAEAAIWTRNHLDDESRSFLESRETADESRDVAVYHASPRDPVWEYVLWPEQAGECIARQASRVAMVGHSHVALCFRADEGGDADDAQGAQVAAGTTLDIAEGRWLLNPGSVGQPRDGDPRAAWLTLDTEAWTATYARVEYPVDAAAESIIEAGLPEHLGRRLAVGQ